jgi:hypothetical protein
MYALEQACQEKPMKITSVYVGEEKHFDNDTIQDRFVVTLEYQGRTMTVDFYMGIGHRKPLRKGYPTKPRAPKVENVLYCLLLDSTALDLTFDEWCGEYGYDTDSRRAYKIFDQCNDQGKQLKRLLGKDYQFFMENNEY